MGLTSPPTPNLHVHKEFSHATTDSTAPRSAASTDYEVQCSTKDCGLCYKADMRSMPHPKTRLEIKHSLTEMHHRVQQ